MKRERSGILLSTNADRGRAVPSGRNRALGLKSADDAVNGTLSLGYGLIFGDVFSAVMKTAVLSYSQASLDETAFSSRWSGS